MSDKTRLEELRSLGLMRHQAVFLANFEVDGSHPHHLLVGGVGLGKSWLAAILCEHMFTRRLARRILLIAPAGLCQQYLDFLTGTLGKDVISLIDFRKFREMEANAEVGTSPWPTPFIAILSYTVFKAKRRSLRLDSCHWDLLVVDEAHLLTDRELSEANVMIREGVVSRSLFLTATPSKGLLCITEPELHKTEWGEDEIDWLGHSQRPPEPVPLLIKFARSKEESEFLETLQSFFNLMPIARNKAAEFFKDKILNKASSSVFAVAKTLVRLRRIINDVVRPTAVTQQDLFVELEGWQEEIGEDPVFMVLLQDFNKSAHLLDLIDEIENDEKLQALHQKLRELTNDANEVYRRICIFSSYAETVLYLDSSLTDVGYNVTAFTGASYGAEETAAGACVLDNKPSLLVTSVSEGWSDQDIDVLIHYDLPSSAARMEQRRGRFNRWGRSKPLRELAFRDKSGVLPFEENLLRMYFPALCV